MGKTLYSSNLSGFKSEKGVLSFSSGEERINIPYVNVLSLQAESNMSAKSGAYVSFTLDTEDMSLMLDSDNTEFFDVLFDMICMELPVDMDELFTVSAAEAKTMRVIYSKKTEE